MARKGQRMGRGGGVFPWLSLALFIGIVSGCFGRVWFQQQSLRAGQQTQRLEAENLFLARQCAALEARLAHLHTPSHLELCAGPFLAPPRRDRLLRVSMEEMRNPLHRTALSATLSRPSDGGDSTP